MKANVKTIKKKRRYDEEFKKQLVKEFEKGELSVPQMERVYGVRSGIIYRWIYKYSTFNEKGYRIVEKKKSTTQKLKLLEQRIRELEASVGRKQIMIDFLESVIDEANEAYSEDLKKNFATRPLGDSKGKERR